eukprot:scaffold1060_cov246-Pinguiococcus_pyrenoidosus.AAC.17
MELRWGARRRVDATIELCNASSGVRGARAPTKAMWILCRKFAVCGAFEGNGENVTAGHVGQTETEYKNETKMSPLIS